MLQNDEHELTAREEVAGEIQDNCDMLQHKLTAFESAWHIVRLACSRLSSDLALARSFTTVRHVAGPHKSYAFPSRLRRRFYHTIVSRSSYPSTFFDPFSRVPARC